MHIRCWNQILQLGKEIGIARKKDITKNEKLHFKSIARKDRNVGKRDRFEKKSQNTQIETVIFGI